MRSSWPASANRMLDSEGLWANNPADPGGATMRGVTLAEARRVIDPKMTVAQLRLLTAPQATTVFKRYYWDVIRGDELPAGVDYAAGDYAINSGPGRPEKVLCHLVGVSGSKITSQVIAELNKRHPEDIVNAVCDERLGFMRGLGVYRTFGSGWERRVKEVRAAALTLARQVPQKDPPLLTPHASQPAVAVPTIAPGKAIASKTKASLGPLAVGVPTIAAATVAVTHGHHFTHWGLTGLAAGLLAGVSGLAAFAYTQAKAHVVAPSIGAAVVPAIR